MNRLKGKEKEMCGAIDHNAKITLINGDVFIGLCTEYTSDLDNEPDPASLTMKNPLKNGQPFAGQYVEIELPEIQTIEVLD